MKKWNKFVAAIIAAVVASCAAPSPVFAQTVLAVAASMEVEGSVDPIVMYIIGGMCFVAIAVIAVVEINEAMKNRPTK